MTTQVAMVQREVGERLAAQPGSPAYGAPSVLAQLACEVRVLRARVAQRLPPGAERRLRARRPAPHRPAARPGAARARQRRLRAPAQGAARARWRWRAWTATAARAALEAIGRPPDARAEVLAPDEWRALHEATAMRLFARAPGKVNLCLFVGTPREDGLHPLVSVVQALSLADELTLEPAAGDADEVVCPGVEGPNLAGRALAALPRGDRVGRAAAAADDRQADPRRRRHGRRLVRRRRGAAARRARRPACPCRRTCAMRLGADVPSLLRPGRVLMTGAGEHVERLPRPGAARRARAARRRRAAHPRRLPRGRPPRPHAHRTPSSPSSTPRARRARRRDPQRPRRTPPARCARAIDAALAAAREAGADHVLVSGSGPTVVGLFTGPDGPARARAAAGAWPRAVAAEPVGEDWARVVPA